MIRYRFAAAAALLQLMALPRAAAQDMPAGADPQSRPAQNNKLDRVEIGSRPRTDTELRRRASVLKQVYGREEMDKHGDSNVADVLKRLPGVDMSSGAPRMRGLGSGYTLILINGDPAPAGFAVDQLSPSQIERIEVTKVATADQSAQAVAGSINFVLRDAPRARQTDLRLGTAYSAKRPTLNASFSHGERAGDWSYSLPIAAFEWRGRNDLSFERLMPGNGGAPAQASQLGTQPTWGHSFNMSPRLGWKGSDESFSLQAFLQRGRWGSQVFLTTLASNSDTLLEDPSLNRGGWQNARLSGQWTQQLTDDTKLDLRLGVSRALGNFAIQTYKVGEPYRTSEGANTDHSVTQSGKLARVLGDAHLVTIGWDLESRRRTDERNVSIQGRQQLPGVDGTPLNARILRQAFYLQDDWEISPVWSLYTGIRHELIQTRGDDFGALVKNSNRVLSPLIHTSYKLDPKGRDLLRGSLTRTYRAPSLNALLARPTLDGLYPSPSQTNTDLGSDIAGNPRLKPELATGIDLAYEGYLSGGGMFSIGIFHRKVDDLIRYVTTLETVPWAIVPRWVSRPQNLSDASSQGIELEIKGRAGELMPVLFDPELPLNLRAAANIYRSRVKAVPLPNNRLDNQQPWSLNLGLDYKLSSAPLTFGASLAHTPGYTSQLTLNQASEQSHTRSLDFYGQWTLDKQVGLRLAANNAMPISTRRRTLMNSGAYLQSDRQSRTNYSLVLEMKL